MSVEASPTPSCPADDSERQRLAEDQREHQAARKSQRLQHRDLLAPLADRHAHRVRRDEQDREGHRQADEVEQEDEVARPAR
mgnify:CR=1 FL=1